MLSKYLKKSMACKTNVTNTIANYKSLKEKIHV